ncbi:MAG: hypothetical protein KDA66_19550, partial [Planctomycetaceae bacterium]|nr:hypothetical protein [Planctomycetaceae bacterium]
TQDIPAKSFKKSLHHSPKKFHGLNTHASHDAQTQRRFSMMVTKHGIDNRNTCNSNTFQTHVAEHQHVAGRQRL